MRNVKKTFLSAAICAVIFIGSILSAQANNGNIITITKDITYAWAPDNCQADWVLSSSARRQVSSDGMVHLDITFELPEGHCDIPARGATITHYDEYTWAIINSNGKVKVKLIYNPNAQ